MTLQVFYYSKVIPLLYLATLWASATSALFLYIGDLYRAAGIASALGLFYIIRGYYLAEMRAWRDAQPNEAQGK